MNTAQRIEFNDLLEDLEKEGKLHDFFEQICHEHGINWTDPYVDPWRKYSCFFKVSDDEKIKIAKGVLSYVSTSEEYN